MRITYDTEVDALTLVVSREEVERTTDVGKGRLIDFDEHGNIVAIEILDVSRGFELLDLMDKYDLKPVLEQFADYVRTARYLLRDDSELRVLVG